MRFRLLELLIDEPLRDARPSTIISMTLLTCVVAVLVREVLKAGGVRRAWQQLLGHVMRAATRMVPGVSRAIEQEKRRMLEKVESALPVASDGEARVTELPEEGLSAAQVLARLERLSEREMGKVREKRLSGTVYMFDEEHERLIAETMTRFMHVNTLHGDVFSSGRKLEGDIVRMTLHMMHGTSDQHCGVVTSGGTESILMAVKAYRDRAMSLSHSSSHSSSSQMVFEIVASTTVHAAFDKACQYFGVKLVHVEPDQQTFQLRASSVRKCVTRNTILIVASAPCFPQGTVDPVRELGQLALECNVGLHVDACLGGFVLPFARELGYSERVVPQFDFSVPGVSSMSADTHKYGLACKGTSVLMFSTRELRRHMYFVAPTWTGGIYGSPAIAGSRPGAPIAATWASMMHMGKSGYMKQAQLILQCAKDMRRGIETMIPELVIQGASGASGSSNSDSSGSSSSASGTNEQQLSMVVAFTSAKDSALDIFMVNDAMSERGWALNALQYPKGLHYAITGNTVGKVDQFLQDLKSAVHEVKHHPERFKKGMAPVYGAAVALPDKQLVVELTLAFIDALVDGPRAK